MRAIDGVGNVDPTPASFTWTIDTAAPDTTIDSSPSNRPNAARRRSASAAPTRAAASRASSASSTAAASRPARARRTTRVCRRQPHLPGARDRRRRQCRPDAGVVHVDDRHDGAGHDDRRATRRTRANSARRRSSFSGTDAGRRRRASSASSTAAASRPARSPKDYSGLRGRQPHLPGARDRRRRQRRPDAGVVHVDDRHVGAGHDDRQQAVEPERERLGVVQLQRHRRGTGAAASSASSTAAASRPARARRTTRACRTAATPSRCARPTAPAIVDPTPASFTLDDRHDRAGHDDRHRTRRSDRFSARRVQLHGADDGAARRASSASSTAAPSRPAPARRATRASPTAAHLPGARDRRRRQRRPDAGTSPGRSTRRRRTRRSTAIRPTRARSTRRRSRFTAPTRTGVASSSASSTAAASRPAPARRATRAWRTAATPSRCARSTARATWTRPRTATPGRSTRPPAGHDDRQRAVEPDTSSSATPASPFIRRRQRRRELRVPARRRRLRGLHEPEGLHGPAEGSTPSRCGRSTAPATPTRRRPRYTWTIDTAAPDTTIDGKPANPTDARRRSASRSASEQARGRELRVQARRRQLRGLHEPEDYSGCRTAATPSRCARSTRAGNADPTPASYTWTIDTTAPDTTIDGNPADPTQSTSSASFSFSGNDAGSGVASFECQLDGGGFSACTSPQDYAGLRTASHTFEVRAIDGVGNADPTPDSFTWTIDTTAPDTTIGDQSAGPDGSSVGVVQLQRQRRRPAPRASSASSTAAASRPAPARRTTRACSDGGHTFQVRAIDERRQRRPDAGLVHLDDRQHGAGHDDRQQAVEPERERLRLVQLQRHRRRQRRGELRVQARRRRLLGLHQPEELLGSVGRQPHLPGARDRRRGKRRPDAGTRPPGRSTPSRRR